MLLPVCVLIWKSSILYPCTQRQRRHYIAHTMFNWKEMPLKENTADVVIIGCKWIYSLYLKLPHNLPVSLPSHFTLLPLMRSGGRVIFSIVPRAWVFPQSSGSSKTSAGTADRNSLPCRYQSPSLLTIILICTLPPPFTRKARVSCCPLQENKGSLWLLLTG